MVVIWAMCSARNIINPVTCHYLHHLCQSSSRMADRPSASSTQDVSYFVFFIGAPHVGQLLYGLSQTVLHAEQINSSARKRCVRCIQWADFILILPFSQSDHGGSCHAALEWLLHAPETCPVSFFALEIIHGSFGRMLSPPTLYQRWDLLCSCYDHLLRAASGLSGVVTLRQQFLHIINITD